MTDKIQKIREGIERLKSLIGNNSFLSDYEKGCNDGREDMCNEIISIIDSMQEEPVSNPIDFEKELYKAFGQVKDFTLGMRIAKRFYDMGKNSQEPVSEDLAKEIEKLSERYPEISFAKLSRIAVAVARWQQRHIPVSHDKSWRLKEQLWLKKCNLKDASYQYIYDASNDWMIEIPVWNDVQEGFEAGAQWQKQKDSMPVSEDLEEAVNAYIGYAPEVDESSSTYGKRQAFKAGAQWQKERLMAKAIDTKLLEGHLIRQRGVTHPLHVGDKVKVILIKWEEI